MCGIFGVAYAADAGMDAKQTHQLLDFLFSFSQSRGQEAAGLMLLSKSGCVINKGTLPGKQFIKQESYRNYFREPFFKEHLLTRNGFLAIGHARLDTQGSKWDNNNNAPLSRDNLVGVHNGIIVNVEELWQALPNSRRALDVDSEVLLALYHDQSRQHDPVNAIKKSLALIEGSASVAIYDDGSGTVVLGTNTGSLYIAEYGKGLFVFASEAYILRRLHEKHRFLHSMRPFRMQQVTAGSALAYSLRDHGYGAYTGRIVNEVL